MIFDRSRAPERSWTMTDRTEQALCPFCGERTAPDPETPCVQCTRADETPDWADDDWHTCQPDCWREAHRGD